MKCLINERLGPFKVFECLLHRLRKGRMYIHALVDAV
jgi:hypothetical protein